MTDTTQTKEKVLRVIAGAIERSLPYDNTKKILSELKTDGELTVFSIGKAAVPMARAAAEVLGGRIKTGLLVTKYGHTGDFASPYFRVIEAAHPVADENSVLAAETALNIAQELTAEDTVLVLLSGGGSALFEKSTVPPEQQRDVTKKLLARGADIDEMNAVRRRLSLVKGGGFAAACYPAKVITVALSDVLSNDKTVIASGITVEDTADDAFVAGVADRYLYDIAPETRQALFRKKETKINGGGFYFAGDIDSLCLGAKEFAEKEGFDPVIKSKSLTGEARERAAQIIEEIKKAPPGTALIYGGETTVTLRGSGRGGRNQEMALAAALALEGGDEGIVFASAGSDGTDGPTDAAGGIVDAGTCAAMRENGISPAEALADNDSYHALRSCGALIVTGATGTNVNDVTIAVKPTEQQY